MTRCAGIGYDAGAVKQLDVLQAQDTEIDAEVALAQSHFALVAFAVVLVWARGRRVSKLTL